MKLFIFFFVSLNFQCFFTVGCFDENLSSSLCHLCSYDAYPNLTSIDWSWSDYSNQSCIPKLSISQEFEIFVNSSKPDCVNAACDGSMLFPFNDFFIALEFAFFKSLQYLNSNITIFLFGKYPFYLYTDKTSEKLFIFRRAGLNITIQPLLCKIKMVSECFLDESYFSQIILKNNNILFFISNQMTLRNVQFNGIDIIAFNLISDSVTKKIYRNQTLCDETDLLVLNDDPLKKLCFLNQISINTSSQGFYSFFNIENLYDCDSCTAPILQIENCQFSFMNFINDGPNIISLISFEVGLKFDLSLTKSQLSKVFFPSGAFSLRNVANDNFYKSFSYSVLVQNIKTAQYCNISFENNVFSDFNYFQLVMTPENPYSVFNLNITQISSVLNQLPTFSLLFKNNSISNFFQDENFLIYFVVISGFHTLSSFTFQNNSIVNFSNIYIFYNGNKFFTATLETSIFADCKDIFFDFGPSFFTISNVTFQNLIITSRSLIFIEDDLEIKSCNFTNIFSTNNVLFSLIEIGSNSVFPQILISYSNFSNFTSVAISGTLPVYGNFSIINCSFQSITLSITDSLFRFETANFQLNSSSFINLIGYSVFRIGFLKNFQLSDLVISNSQISFLSLYISTYGIPEPFVFARLTRISISQLGLFSKYFIFFTVCDESSTQCLTLTQVIYFYIMESEFQEIEWKVAPNPINFIIYSGGSQFALFEKVNFSKIEGDYDIFGDSGYFNVFWVLRDSYFLSGNMILMNLPFFNVESSVFQTNFRYLDYQNTYPNYLILRNSNFTNSQLALNIMIYSIKWLIIANCHFYQNYNDISISFQLSDVDPDFFLNQNENLFFMNYFQFCTTVPQPLSFEDCESIMRNNSAPILYIDSILFMNYTDILYLFFNDFGIINSTFEGTISSIFILDETNPTNLVFRNVTFLNFRHENNSDLMIQSSSYNLFFFKCTFLNISYIDSSAILLINSNAYFSKCNFFSIEFQSLYDGFMSFFNSKGYFYGIYVSQLKAFQFGFLNGEKSYLVFEHSTFNHSYVSTGGGFFYFQRSDIIINNCSFLNGNSLYRGAIMFLYLLNSFIMTNSVIRESFVGQSGLIYFESGNLNVIHIFTNVSFLLNSGKFGVCIFSKEANLEINNGIYTNNSADDSIIYCISQIQNINISIFNSSILNCISNANILYFENQFVSLEYITFSNFSSQTSLIFFSSSNVQMRNCWFTNLKDYSQDNNNQKFIIYSSKSPISSDSLFFYANLYGICIYLQSGEIILNNSQFKNCLIAIQNIQNSSLNVYNCSFVENQGLKSGAIYLSDSNLYVSLSSFEGNFQSNNIFKGGNDIYAQNSISSQMLFLSVSDSKINNYGFISISVQGNYSLNISNTYIFGGKANITQAFFLVNINKFSVFNCSIEQTNYYSAIEISNTELQFLTIYIDLSNFSHCNSFFSGGVLSLGGSHYDIIILNSKFEENSANFYGGALYIYFIETPQISSCKIEKNVFVNNRAQLSGGAIKIFFQNFSTLVNLNSFQNNEAFSGNSVSGVPAQIQINKISSTEFYLESVSGSYLQFNISVLDMIGNILITEEGQIIIDQDSHNISNISNLLILYNKQILVNASASFTIYTFGTPNNTYPIVFSFQNEMTSFNKSGFLNLRQCQRGESLVNSICLPCDTDFYSYDITMKCQNCPPNAFCPGKDMIIPLQGYWKYHQDSAVLKQCFNKLSCPDQRQYFIINGSNDYNYSKPFAYFCAKGSYGNLCSNCEQGYGSSSQKLCIKCGFSYQTLFLMIFNFLVLMYQSIKSFDSSSADKSQRSLIKLLINHGNYLILLNSFPEILQKNLSYLLSMNKQIDVIGTISDSTIFDCFLQDFVSTENLVIARVAFFSFVPIIIVVSLFAFRLILLILPVIKNKIGDKNKFRILVSCFISVIYSFYPKIVNNAFTLLKCVNLDEQERSFLEIDPNVQCWQDTHLNFIKTVFVPNLLIWCLGWPLCLFMMLFWRKKSRRTTILKERSLSSKKNVIETEANLITSPSKIKSLFYLKESSPQKLSDKDKADIFQTHKIYRFLTFEYDVNFYYWDEFFYLTNLLLSICSLLRQILNEVVFSEILLGVFFLLLVVINKCEPFKFREINFICSISFGVIFATFYCIVNLSFLSEEASVPINFYVVLIFLFNGVFYCYWLYIFVVGNIINKLKDQLQKIKKIIKKKLEKRKK